MGKARVWLAITADVTTGVPCSSRKSCCCEQIFSSEKGSSFRQETCLAGLVFGVGNECKKVAVRMELELYWLPVGRQNGGPGGLAI